MFTSILPSTTSSTSFRVTHSEPTTNSAFFMTDSSTSSTQVSVSPGECQVNSYSQLLQQFEFALDLSSSVCIVTKSVDEHLKHKHQHQWHNAFWENSHIM